MYNFSMFHQKKTHTHVIMEFRAVEVNGKKTMYEKHEIFDRKARASRQEKERKETKMYL